jgi:hypothetical protein
MHPKYGRFKIIEYDLYSFAKTNAIFPFQRTVNFDKYKYSLFGIYIKQIGCNVEHCNN